MTYLYDQERRPLLPIPIPAAEVIARKYGYDQVVVYARRTGEHPLPSGEHMTTFGITPEHCEVAALMGSTMKRVAQWPSREDVGALQMLYDDLQDGVFDYTDHDERQKQIDALGRLLGRIK